MVNSVYIAGIGVVRENKSRPCCDGIDLCMDCFIRKLSQDFGCSNKLQVSYEDLEDDCDGKIN